MNFFVGFRTTPIILTGACLAADCRNLKIIPSVRVLIVSLVIMRQNQYFTGVVRFIRRTCRVWPRAATDQVLAENREAEPVVVCAQMCLSGSPATRVFLEKRQLRLSSMSFETNDHLSKLFFLPSFLNRVCILGFFQVNFLCCRCINGFSKNLLRPLFPRRFSKQERLSYWFHTYLIQLAADPSVLEHDFDLWPSRMTAPSG